MPMNRALYPANWDEIARQIKTEVDWNCEECGKVCRRSNESLGHYIYRLIVELRISVEVIEDIIDHPQRYTLTVAHLDHCPEKCDRSNLRALCAPCHCRYDLSSIGTKQQLKLERVGQLKLWL